MFCQTWESWEQPKTGGREEMGEEDVSDMQHSASADVKVQDTKLLFTR